MNGSINEVFNWLGKTEDMALAYAPKIIGAIVVYLVGRWIITRLSRLFTLVLDRRHIDPSLRTFFTSFVKIGLIVLLLLAVIGIVGIPIAGFAAIIAGLAFGIGSALNGSLGNVAGGIMILVTRPFRIGDLIEAQNHFGIVKEIGIIDTTILTSQNKTVHLPNGALSTGVITNYTDQEHLRIDLRIPVYDTTDVAEARRIAVVAMRSVPGVIADPPPDVKVTEITGSGIVLVLWPRMAIKPYDPQHPRQMEADYYGVYFGVQEAVKTAFQQHGVSGPVSAHEVKMLP